MTHLELESLASDYLEGRLASALKAQAEAHLDGCSGCRELIIDLRHALDLCQSAPELEPAPWLIAKILGSTTGRHKPTWTEQVVAFLRPALQPRLAYTVAMAVFSISVVINAAGMNLRKFRLRDFNPRTWIYRADRAGHLLYARAEKFYYDLKVVYEIESRFRQLRSEPQQQDQTSPKPEPPSGGSTDGQQTGSPQLAFAGEPLRLPNLGDNPSRKGTGQVRSPSQ